MTIERILIDIPEDEVDRIVADFESEGCTTQKIEQDDGLWTVKAQCPEQ
ncbi:hypothetical protein [Desulfospira joergensenii]|nr:hypothetical protein [Desulfospira joergensenii]